MNDFWTAMEKSLRGYALNPKGGVINTPFPPTYDTRRNHLKLAFREQDKIGSDNLIKGRTGRQGIECTKQHIQNENLKTTGTRMGTKNETRIMGSHATTVAISE
jgi:hypothetical protein